MINPLLTQFNLPPFSLIPYADIKHAVETVVCYCYEIVEEILSQKHTNTWDTLCYPLQFAENQLRRVWSPIEHLYAVQNTLELSQIYEKSKIIVVEYETWVNQHYDLYCAYYNFKNTSYYLSLTKPQKSFVMNRLSRFIFFGCELSNLGKRKQCAAIYKKLSNLVHVYSNNVLYATNSWKKLIFDEKRLYGLSKYDLDLLAYESKIHGNESGWLLTLKYPIYLSVMKHCEDITLREEMYWAYNTRASDQGPDAGCWDNTLIICEILSLRYELAKLLGFNSYSDAVLRHRMAKRSDRVLSFLKYLSVFISLYARDFFADLSKFIRKHYGRTKLYPWDMLFYIEKYRVCFLNLDESELRYFFPVNHVIEGIFKIVNYIYGINIFERYGIDSWHSDVRFFDIFDVNDKWLGGFYLDIYSRDNKFPGAWMDDFVSMMYDVCGGGIKQRPIAYLICNFNVNIIKNDEYVFLSHDEVCTLLHEFGHVLHHIMTIIDIPDISGIHGVPLDAVEVPSQFMEKFGWDSHVLQMITSHYLTGESLSVSLIDKLIKFKKYQSSYSLLYQLIYSIFDISIHYESCGSQNFHFMNIFNNIKKELSIFPTVEWERFPHSFDHIFSCDYAAGYYSYLWSDVLASDIWLYFKENGMLNYRLGKLFLDKILARGGSEEFSDLFFNFMGRKSSVEFLLYYYRVVE